MRLELKTAPAVASITTADVKEYGYINTTEHDTLIGNLIEEGTEYIEHLTGRKMINQSWYIYYDREEYYSRLRAYNNSLDLAGLNVSAITEVLTYNESNTSSVLSSSYYRLSGGVNSVQCNMVFNDNTPPERLSLRLVDAVRVEVVAGYGASQASVPTALVGAIAQYIKHRVLYPDVVNEQNTKTNLWGLRSMVAKYVSPSRYF